MECKVCGKYNENENANFCYNCGNSFRDSYQNYSDSTYNNQWNNSTPNQSNNTYNTTNDNSYGQSSYNNNQSGISKKDEEPVSFKSWLLMLALPFLLLFVPIPFVGPIAYIVLLFVWAFGKDTQTSKKNWARANLVVSIIMLIVTIVFTVFVFSSIMDGTFPLEGFEGLEGFGGMGNFY